jgi:transposase-like protein
MQIILSFKEGIQEYKKEYKSNKLEIERPKQCPRCGGAKVYKWGKYYRYVIEEERESLIPIQRIRCAKCGGTGSYLPDFCLSRIQYSVDYVMKLLEMILIHGKIYAEEIKARIYFFKQRYLAQLNVFITYLRGNGMKELSTSPKEKAIEVFAELSSLARKKADNKLFPRHSETFYG